MNSLRLYPISYSSDCNKTYINIMTISTTMRRQAVKAIPEQVCTQVRTRTYECTHRYDERTCVEHTIIHSLAFLDLDVNTHTRSQTWSSQIATVHTCVHMQAPLHTRTRNSSSSNNNNNSTLHQRFAFFKQANAGIRII